MDEAQRAAAVDGYIQGRDYLRFAGLARQSLVTPGDVDRYASLHFPLPGEPAFSASRPLSLRSEVSSFAVFVKTLFQETRTGSHSTATEAIRDATVARGLWRTLDEGNLEQFRILCLISTQYLEGRGIVNGHVGRGFDLAMQLAGRNERGREVAVLELAEALAPKWHFLREAAKQTLPMKAFAQHAERHGMFVTFLPQLAEDAISWNALLYCTKEGPVRVVTALETSKPEDMLPWVDARRRSQAALPENSLERLVAQIEPDLLPRADCAAFVREAEALAERAGHVEAWASVASLRAFARAGRFIQDDPGLVPRGPAADRSPG